MKYQHMIDMLFVLLAKRRISAGELAARYNISVRTVYRYIDEMTVAGIPIDVARGAGGGIYISDTYKLPKGYMTREEYESAIGAMQAMESELGDPALSSAISKLSAKAKEERQDDAITGNILVDSGTWGNERKFSEKLALLERAIAEKEALEIRSAVFMRDTIFFLLSLMGLVIFIVDGTIYGLEAIYLLVIFVGYVVCICLSPLVKRSFRFNREVCVDGSFDA